MIASVYYEFGNPQDVIHIEDKPVPEPGAGEVLIKTTYAVIHNHNLLTVKGIYGIRPQLPHTDGTEATGTITKLGSGVMNVKVGQRVSVAMSLTGTWAEYFLVPAAAVVALPDSVDDEAAAQIISMPMSACLLLNHMGLKKGDCFIYNGANGLVGIVLAYLARAKGINMIKVVRRAAAKKYLERLGFEHVVSTNSKGWEEQAKAAAGNSPIIAAVDNVGGREGGDLFNLLAENGILVVFGRLSGEEIPVSAGEFIFLNKQVVGFWVSTAFKTTPREKLMEYQADIIRLVENGELKFSVGGVYDLKNIGCATKASVEGKEGKILLRP